MRIDALPPPVLGPAQRLAEPETGRSFEDLLAQANALHDAPAGGFAGFGAWQPPPVPTPQATPSTALDSPAGGSAGFAAWQPLPLSPPPTTAKDPAPQHGAPEKAEAASVALPAATTVIKARERAFALQELGLFGRREPLASGAADPTAPEIDVAVPSGPAGGPEAGRGPPRQALSVRPTPSALAFEPAGNTPSPRTSPAPIALTRVHGSSVRQVATARPALRPLEARGPAAPDPEPRASRPPPAPAERTPARLVVLATGGQLQVIAACPELEPGAIQRLGQSMSAVAAEHGKALGALTINGRSLRRPASSNTGGT